MQTYEVRSAASDVTFDAAASDLTGVHFHSLGGASVSNLRRNGRVARWLFRYLDSLSPVREITWLLYGSAGQVFIGHWAICRAQKIQRIR